VYLYHCLETVVDADVAEPERLSKLLLNSTVNSAFTSLQNIKRPAKSSIPEATAQNVTWIGESNVMLEVHTGRHGLERKLVSHAMLQATFKDILGRIRSDLVSLGVSVIKYEEFKQTRDSRTSTSPGEGMGTFNPQESVTALFVKKNSDKHVRLQFMEKASKLYRLTIAAIHLSGGPSPRGTEEAVIRLTNSDTELVRNVQMMQHTIGVENG
jgi:hypothetical protein